MEKKKGISTRMRNLMNAHIGKVYNYYYGGTTFMWSVTIKSIMDDSGYFITEINDGNSVFKSNCSYGEIKHNLKKGIYVEA